MDEIRSFDFLFAMCRFLAFLQNTSKRRQNDAVSCCVLLRAFTNFVFFDRATDIDRMMQENDYAAVSQRANIYKLSKSASKSQLGDAIESGDWDLVAAMADEIDNDCRSYSSSPTPRKIAKATSEKAANIQRLVDAQDWAGIVEASERFKREEVEMEVSLNNSLESGDMQAARRVSSQIGKSAVEGAEIEVALKMATNNNNNNITLPLEWIDNDAKSVVSGATFNSTIQHMASLSKIEDRVRKSDDTIRKSFYR